MKLKIFLINSGMKKIKTKSWLTPEMNISVAVQIQKKLSKQVLNTNMITRKRKRHFDSKIVLKH